MSSDRTKQICLWMTIYIYIYIAIRLIDIYIYVMIPPDTKLICWGGDFLSWNFRIMGQVLPYKWRYSIQPAKAVVWSVNILPTRRNMFDNDNIIIYIDVKKRWERNKAFTWCYEMNSVKIAVGQHFQFSFSYLEYFSLNWTEISSKTVSYSEFFV